MEHKVTTYYLEMNSKDSFIAKKGYTDKIEIKEIDNDSYINFIFFAGVGLPFKWYSRLKWDIKKWKNYFKENKVKTFIGFSENKLIGYYELEKQNNNTIEIKFFGLLPNYIGKGLGSMFLSHAIKSSWQLKPQKVWLHTCSIDHQFAYKNYLARGFELTKQVEDIENIPSKEELLKLISNYYKNFIESYTN